MIRCKYLLDTNIILTAYRRYYAFDLVPSFWNRLSASASKNEWALIDYVCDELLKQKDAISDWIRAQYSGEVLSSSESPVITAYGTIIEEVHHNHQYFETAKQEFASTADSWLIAHALAGSYCIVTEEKFEPEVRKRVKIPNECKKHGIEYINTFDFMRKIGISMI
jgi:hypothetical protein